MAPLVTNAGKAIAANRAKGSGTEPLNVGWGSGSTAEAAADTDLATALPEARTAGTSSIVTTTVTNDTYRVVGTITATASRAVNEVGTFDAAGSGSPPSGGNLFIRAVHGVQNLSTNDSIEYTVDCVFG